MGEKFRFIHVADTHCGHSGNASRYNEFSPLRIAKETEKGVNIRQNDIDKAFKQVIDIAIDKKVDAVIHAGDGWDFWGYKQPYVDNVYTEQVTRLNPHGIFYLEIVGNHNLPKQIGKGCHLKSLGRFPGVQTIYQGFYERHEVPNHDDVVVHCVPSTFNQEILNDSLSQVEKEEGKINIGVGHFGVTTINFYAENSHNSLVVDLDSLINLEMDYWALGDYHVPTHFKPHNIYYPGPVERLGFGEIGIEPQVLLVEIDKETKEMKVEPIFLDVRPMIELPFVDAKGKDIDTINEEIFKTISDNDLKDKIVRFRIKHLPTHLKKLIDVMKIKDLTEESLYFKLEFKDKVNKTKEARTAQGVDFKGVLSGWHDFANTIEADGSFDKEKLIERGYKKLAEVYEDATD